MRRLILETTTEIFSIALFDGNTLMANEHAILGRGHAERILPMIAALPGGGQCDEIRVGCGPGSFTGVRIGIAAAKGLGLVWKIPVHGYSLMSLIDTAAIQLNSDYKGRARAIIMEGGHGEWFVQLRDPQTHSSELRSLAPAQAVSWVDDRVAIGPRAEAFNSLRGEGEAYPVYPDARWTLHLPEEEILPDATPIYGRGADAKKMVGS